MSWLLGLVLAAVASCALCAGADARSFALADYCDSRDGGFEASALIRVGSVTAARLPGPALRLGDAVASHALSPDHRTAAFGGVNFGRIVLVDLRRWRRTDAVAVGHGSVDVLAWPTRRRLFALTGAPEGKAPTPKTLRIVDPAAGRVLHSQPLGLVLATSTSTAGEIALLVAPSAGIGATTLVTVTPDGNVRSVVLNITGGFTAESRGVPGLAVDFGTQRAWVLGDAVAEVDLRSGAVSDRPALAPDSAPAGPPHDTGTQNPTSGPTRSAQWLGDGRIALSGADAAIVDGRQADTPMGLRILDTRTWTERVLDARAERFGVVGDTVLDARTAYGRTGERRYRLPTSRWVVNRDRLYTIGTRRAQLRDPVHGNVLRRFSATENLFTFFSA